LRSFRNVPREKSSMKFDYCHIFWRESPPQGDTFRPEQQ
jgi:hypothetical protein